MNNYSDDIDGVFACDEITDHMLDADSLTRRDIGQDFPGWMLYRKVLTGTSIFDDELDEWACNAAHALASAKQENGRRYIWQSVTARPGWVTQAAWDALDRVVNGVFPAPLEVRAKRYGVSAPTYRKVRNVIAGGMLLGLETYRGILHYHYLRLRRSERFEK